MTLFPVDEIALSSRKPRADYRHTPDTILIQRAMRLTDAASPDMPELRMSAVEEHDDKKYVLLRCGGGVLAVYSVGRTRLQRLPLHRWPKACHPFNPDITFRASGLSEQQLTERAIQFVREKRMSKATPIDTVQSSVETCLGETYLVLWLRNEVSTRLDFVAAFCILGDEYFTRASWLEEDFIIGGSGTTPSKHES